ncbi:Desmethyl-deoxy-podophyllotoxin synthase [Linum perenne]
MSPMPLLLVITLAAISFISFITKKLTRPGSTSAQSNKYLPPAPRKLPYIGHIHHFITTAQPPHRRLRQLAEKHGDVIQMDLGEIPHVIVSSAEAAKQVMRTHDISFAQRPFHPHQAKVMYGGINLIHAPYGDYWRQLRRIATLELLTARRVESLRRVREVEVLNLVRDISDHADISGHSGSAIDLSKKLFNMTYCIISRAVFGDVSGEQEEFIKVAEEMVLHGGGFGISFLFPSSKVVQKMFGMQEWLDRMHEGVDRLAGSIIRQHREKRAALMKAETEDLLDVLLNLQEDETTLGFNLSNDCIKAFMLDLFLAGSETPSALIEWTMSEMMKHPKVLHKAQSEVRKMFASQGRVDEAKIQELDYFRMVIKETLRLHTPAPLVLPRECREECQIGGYDIPLKTAVVVNVWAIARDPRYWGADAEQFRPERFADTSVSYKGGDFEFLPFGAGKRMCPGMGFGLAAAELSLVNLLFHFDWKLPLGVEPEKLNMDELFGITIRRKNHLELIPSIANPIPISA